MKFCRLFAISFLLFAPSGCNKKIQNDATVPLQQSFQTADPELKHAIDNVNSSLKAGNYTDAAKALAPVADRRNLTEAQKQSIAIALQQMNQALAADPKLDTKEMYDLRARLYRAVDGGHK